MINCRILFLFFTGISLEPNCYASENIYRESEKDIESQIVIERVSGDDLTPFEETGRLEGYQESRFFESPFGVYGIKVGGNLVGLQSINPYVKSGKLIASEMTDVLSGQQGKGYGKKLRAQTETLLGNFIKEKTPCSVRVPHKSPVWPGSEENLYSEHTLPISYVYSDNEWLWGENHPSLASSLKANYGIVCISGLDMGLVQMFSPSNESMWSEHRVDLLLEASKLLMEEDLDKEKKKKAVSLFIDILKDLKLEEDADIVSFINISYFLLGSFQENQSVMDYFQSLEEKDIKNLSNFIKEGSSFKKNPLLNLCEHTSFNDVDFRRFSFL